MTEEETALVRYELPDIKDLLAGRLAPGTVKTYREDVSQYQKFCQEQGLQQFDAQSLALWRDSMVLESTKSPNTINRMLAGVRRTVKEAEKRQYVPASVAYAFNNTEGVSTRALRSRLKPHLRTRLYPEQVRRLCDLPNVDTLLGVRDRALLHTLCSSGLRISELINLTMSQIEQRGSYYILSVLGKTDIEPREALISTEAVRYVHEWVEKRPVTSDYIFCGFDGRGIGAHHRLTASPLTKCGAWRIITAYARAAGLQHITPHSMRRFVGTELSQRDPLLAQRALGHKSLETTQKYYILTGLQAGASDDLF